MSSDLKIAISEIARFILAIAIIVIICLDIMLCHLAYQDWLNKKIQPSNYPFKTTEELGRAARRHGVNFFEIRNGEWTFTRDRDGRVCKAFNNQYRRDQ
jgi:hypothetical protein